MWLLLCTAPPVFALVLVMSAFVVLCVYLLFTFAGTP
jgi:hypothetical protein